MVTTIFTISFILHIITISAIYLLFKQIQRLKLESGVSTAALLEEYLQEIREENNRLQAETAVSGSNNHEQEEHADAIQEHVPPAQAKSVANRVPGAGVADHMETSFQAKVLQLHEQGFSETEIARKLNCGKTEAALTIKLNK